MQDKYSYYIYNIINYEKQVTLVYIASQNKASRTVADISVSGAKLRVSYSDGTSKDMEMPPATSLQLPLIYAEDGTVEGYVVVNKGIRDNGDCLAGDAFYYGYSGWPRGLSYDDYSN